MDPRQLPLAQAEHLTFERSFPVESIGWSNEPTDLTYGGQPLALGPDGQSLYIGIHSPNAYAHVTIPAEGGRGDLIEEGRWIPHEISNMDASVLGGMLRYGNRLLATKFIFYDGGYGAFASHQASDDNGATWTTPATLGDKNPGYYGGYMCNVPPEWQELLGGPCITGQGILSIIGRTSFGPAAFAFDPSNIINSETHVPVVDLLYYTMDNPLHNPEVQNELFTRADMLGGCFIVPGSRSFLVVGFHGMGQPCYGDGSPENPPPPGMCYNPLDGAKGEHTYPYRGQVWAYDLNDLIAVKNGEVEPWSVKPYAVWALPGVSQDAYRVKRGGVAFNPTDGRMYVTEIYWDSPRVDVFHIAMPDTPDPEPPDPEPPVEDDCVTNPLVITGVSVEVKKENQITLRWTGPEDVIVTYNSMTGVCEFTDSRGCSFTVTVEKG